MTRLPAHADAVDADGRVECISVDRECGGGGEPADVRAVTASLDVETADFAEASGSMYDGVAEPARVAVLG